MSGAASGAPQPRSLRRMKSTRAPASTRSPKPQSNRVASVGDVAPDFTISDARGARVSLAASKGRVVVLFFYPKDDTTACTQEACDFQENLARFRRLGCTVLGISPDSVGSHARFAAKHGLRVTLLSDDPDASGTPPVCSAYGVWQRKSMYGRTYMGVVRTTLVVGRDGVVARRFDKVRVKGHLSEVLAAVKALD